MRQFVLLLLSFLVTDLPAQWQYVGNSGFSNFMADFTFLAINKKTSEPYVAFRGIYSRATVMKFDGVKWDTVGNRSISVGVPYGLSMAFDSSGTPYIAYTDNTNCYRALVKKFDGTTWVNVGQPFFSSGAVSFISIAITTNGTPYVAFRDQGSCQYNTWPNGFRATVMKFDGSNWVYVGSAGFSGGSGVYGASNTFISFDNNDIPYVVYSDDSNNDLATVQKFDGTNWIYVGAPGFASWNAYGSRSMAFDSNNNPYVVCASGGKAIVKKFDGTSWITVGTPCSQGNTDFANVAIDSHDTLYVAFQDLANGHKATAMKFDGTNWISLGSAGFAPTGTHGAQDITIDIDNSHNVYIGFSDGSTQNWYATVMKYGNSTGEIKGNIISYEFSVSPNPTRNIINVHYKGEATEVIITIRNELGQLILSKKYSSQKELRDSFDLGNQPKGIYFIELISEKTFEIKKVILE